MNAFVFLMTILFIVILISFAKPIYYSYIVHRYNQFVRHQIIELPTLYEKCVFIETTQYGLGESQNASIPFSTVHSKYQKLAVSSVLIMLPAIGVN